jgi:hypothetical protein
MATQRMGGEAKQEGKGMVRQQGKKKNKRRD